MDFDRFLDLCGRSIFPEEYRGDLDAAWDELQRNLPRRSTGNEPELEPQAEYLRCLCIYSILTGRLTDAYDSLNTLHGLLDKLPPEWGLRYTNYTLLADYTRRFPPFLRFYHEQGKAPNLPTLSDIIGPIDMTKKFMDGVHKYVALGVPRDQGLCRVLEAVSSVPMRRRNLNARLHPLCPKTSVQREDISPEALVAEMATPFVQLKEMADTYGITGVATYLARLIVEFHLECQSSSQEQVLEELYTRCDNIGDRSGTANCKMLQGDKLLCPPFASPISLNLIVVDSANATGENPLWDPVEIGLPFEYSAQVGECYESALRLFRDSGCRRGQAAIMLRQACCLHNVARRLLSTDETRVEILEEVTEKLRESHELFGRDETNTQIVKAHQILVGITKRNTQGFRRAAKAIGEWAVQTGNEMVAHFLGLLMSRFAQQEWKIFSRMDTALSALECAYEILEKLDDTLPMFQTVVGQACIHYDMFNLPASQVLIEQAVSMVDRLSEDYDRKMESASMDTPLGQVERKTLLINKFNTLFTFDNKIASIYLRLEDFKAFDNWQTRFAHFIEHDESFRDLQEGHAQPSETETFGPYKQGTFSQQMKYSWKENRIHNVVRAKYGSCNIRFWRFLKEGDIERAEETFQRFVDEAEHLEYGYTRDLYRVLACHHIGDSAKARAILDTMDDNQLFAGNLDEYLQGTGVKHTFPSVAENALTYTIFGGDLRRASSLLNLIIKISPSFFDSIDENALDFSMRLALYGAIMMRNHNPEAAFRRLLEARQMIELCRSHTVDVDARVGITTSGWIREAFLDLSRSCLRCNEMGIPHALMDRYDHGHPDTISWIEHALLFVEEHRARTVLDSLQGHSAPTPLNNTGSTLLANAVYKRRTLRSLLALRSPTPEQRREISQLQKEMKELDAAELSSTTATFIADASLIVEPRLLYQGIDENAVVIEATFGMHGYIAFAVTREGIQQVHQGCMRLVDIQRPALQLMQLMREMTGYRGEEEERRKERLRELSEGISSVLLNPFTEAIRQKTHVIFSVSAPLTAFPFSVLMFEGQPLVMHAAVSQIPSLTVLYYISQRQTAPSASPTVSVFAKSPTTSPTSDATRADNETSLYMAGIEAINIARMFSNWPIEASQLSRNDFREYLKGKSSILHIGTHGDIDHSNPLMSSIMIGEDFRVLDLSAIQSHVRLLVFAACLSGLGMATAGSEVLGFSHVVLGTGCQTYLGTLWNVSDFASMLVMTFFYQKLKTNPHIPLAEILRQAQTEVLSLDSDRANQILDQIGEGWGSMDHNGNCPEDFVPDAAYLLLMTKMTLDQLDWSSPFFWASFVLMGYGGLRFSNQMVV